MSFTRKQLRDTDMTFLFWKAVGVLIGKALRGGCTTFGVCVVLKLFGVI